MNDIWIYIYIYTWIYILYCFTIHVFIALIWCLQGDDDMISKRPFADFPSRVRIKIQLPVPIMPNACNAWKLRHLDDTTWMDCFCVFKTMALGIFVSLNDDFRFFKFCHNYIYHELPIAQSWNLHKLTVCGNVFVGTTSAPVLVFAPDLLPSHVPGMLAFRGLTVMNPLDGEFQ